MEQQLGVDLNVWTEATGDMVKLFGNARMEDVQRRYDLLMQERSRNSDRSKHHPTPERELDGQKTRPEVTTTPRTVNGGCKIIPFRRPST